MKTLKESYYVREILKVLLKEDIISTSKIAEIINLSEKATRNKVDHVKDYLIENHLGTIEKKPRVGIWLNADEKQLEKITNIVNNGGEVNFGFDAKERRDEVLKLFFRLLPRETITTQRIADELYVSTPTVLKIIKECEEWLTPFHISIINERNRGCYLRYEETNFRIAMKNFIMDNGKIEDIKKQINYFFSSIDIELIKKSIIETENEWNYRFTDNSFYEILIYCCLAYQRKDLQVPEKIAEEDLEILERYNEYPFTVAIFKKLHEKMHTLFTNEDVLFLSTQILCSKFIGINDANDVISNISKYDQKILDFIDEMITLMGNVLGVDLSNDRTLKESLMFHLRPTIFRLRYGMPEGNSLVNFIKSEYKTVFRAAWSISILFEKYFNLQITEDELGYIVLYIQSALERKNYSYSAILLADSNLGHAQLLCERIKKIVPEIHELKVISYHDFKLFNYPDVDIIISSKELHDRDTRIIVINNLLSDSGISCLRNVMDMRNLRRKSESNHFEPICLQLFSPELIFVNVKAKSKDELLKKLSDKMELKGFVTKKFFDTVMEREKATTTCIGNQIALPHGAMSEVNESHVAIAILDEPIVWNDEMVDIVFLLGFKMSTHEEIRRIETFYKQYISLIESEEKIKLLKSKKSNIELYRYLIQ